MTIIEGQGFESHELEPVEACPACGAVSRTTAFEGLVDRLFGAPGEWRMVRCLDCRSLYLDPRPTEAALWKAYAGYYTHQPFGEEVLRPLDRAGPDGAARNGYLRLAHGHRAAGRSLWRGLLLAKAARREEDYFIRHLRPPRSGARLLDIGCGAGRFLPLARALGYEAHGIDPDPQAVEIARAAGFEVRQGSLPDSGLSEAASFDEVTLHHVFEHLHRPLEGLMEVARLLRPGGRIWLSQPNAAALGLERFGADWRGLEPPRHLALYDPAALCKLLRRAGFERVRVLPPERAGFLYVWFSYDLRYRRDPSQPVPSAEIILAEGAALDDAASRDPGRSESVTVVARKPS